MPGNLNQIVGGIQGGQPQNPYAGSPPINQQQAASILQAAQAPNALQAVMQQQGPALPVQQMLAQRAAQQAPQAAPQAAMQAAAPQSSLQAAAPQAASLQAAAPQASLQAANPQLQSPYPTMMRRPQPFGAGPGMAGFGGFSPLPPNAYAQSPQQGIYGMQGNPYAQAGWGNYFGGF